MLFKHYLALIESKDLSGRHLWIACSKDCARRLMAHGPTRSDIFNDSGEGAESAFEGDDDPVVLEFKILPHTPMDIRQHHDVFTVVNPKAVKFIKVWSGVVDDKLIDQFKDNEVDEYAAFGLKRCTAVTVNALYKHFGKPGIGLADVPETDVGVLEILTKGGLAYKPVVGSAGRTLTQFVSLNRRGAFYLVTQGHAMALVDQELFDAENRGADSRKIIEAYLITKR